MNWEFDFWEGWIEVTADRLQGIGNNLDHRSRQPAGYAVSQMWRSILILLRSESLYPG